MTKKDYEMIATAISVNYEIAIKHKHERPTPDFAIELVANTLAGIFKEDNARFDKEKFLKACGMENSRRYEGL